MCTGCIVSVLVKSTASWQRWRLAGQLSTWSLWRCCWRTCRSAPRWQVTGTANGPLEVTHIGHFISPPWCVLLSLSGIYRELCLESVKHKYDCETQAACQHWEVRNTHIFLSSLLCLHFRIWYHVCAFVQSEKLLLFDTVQNELEEKIRRLEEDRHSIDITSGMQRHCVMF